MHLAWDDLQTIEALVRTGSVIGAARELGLRHSSISRRIDALERALAAPLFLRGTRLQPTELARSIASRAEGMARQAKEIDSLIQSAQRARERRLVITTNDVLAPLVFGAVATLEAGHTVQVRISDAEAELQPGITDLALRPGNQPKGALRGYRLGKLRLGVFTARAKPKDDRWILPAPELRQRASIRWWKAIPAGAGGPVECNSLLAMRDACVAGLGKAALPALLAVDDPRLELIERLEGGPPVWLLSPPTRSSDKALRQIAERLAASIRSARGVWESQ